MHVGGPAGPLGHLRVSTKEPGPPRRRRSARGEKRDRGATRSTQRWADRAPPGQRTEMARSFEETMLEKAPDTVLVHFVADAEVIAERMRAAPSEHVSASGGQIMPHIEEEPRVPLMLHFGAEDAGIPLENVHAIAQRWPHIDVHIYEEAGHGFNCAARGRDKESSAALALERTLEHFAQHLDG